MGRIHSAFFHVVCATLLGKEVMDRFIKKNYIDEDQWNLVFVDSIDENYNQALEAPVENESSPDSRFIGKTPQECHQLLLKLVENTESEIMTECFAIMDDRSITDDTVLLVCVERDDEEKFVAWPTVRATFQVTAVSLKCYHSGHSRVGEDLERAEREQDNVYRVL